MATVDTKKLRLVANGDVRIKYILIIISMLIAILAVEETHGNGGYGNYCYAIAPCDACPGNGNAPCTVGQWCDFCGCLDDRNNQGCCGSEIIDRRTQSCCNDKPYNWSNQGCCGGKIYNLGGNQWCCGGLYYGVVCPLGFICMNTLNCSCPSGKTNCSGVCQDVLNDANNCGKCGNVCPSGNCSAGNCTCPSGQVNCGNSCKDVMHDVANCGRCGNVCPIGGACTNGVCECPSGEVDTNDVNNCGKCGNVCLLAGSICYKGMCISDTYLVPGKVPEIEQTEKTCWAAAFTMLYDWKMQKSYTIDEVMNIAGPDFYEMYKNHEALSKDDEYLLIAILGFTQEPETAISYPVEGWAYLLQRYGSLLVVTQTGDIFTHGYVVTGIETNFSPERTRLYYQDPAEGGKLMPVEYEEFEKEFVGNGANNIRIIHK